jgi:hypothetical protein
MRYISCGEPQKRIELGTINLREGLPMSESKEQKKVSLADAIRAKLEQKKQQNQSFKPGGFQGNSPQAMKSQNNKKPNNQRRRTGGS